MKLRDELIVSNMSVVNPGVIPGRAVFVYNPLYTYYFDIVYYSTGACTILLKTGTTTLATITGANTGGIYTTIRSAAFTPLTGSNTVYAEYSTSGTTYIVLTKVVRTYNNTRELNSTTTKYELFRGVQGLSNTTAEPQTNPLYFKYIAANYDGTITFSVDLTFLVSNSMYGITAILQQADGTGDGFVGWADHTTLINGGLNTTETFATISVGALTNNRNYRIVAYIANSMGTYNIHNARLNVIQTGTTSEASASGSQSLPFGGYTYNELGQSILILSTRRIYAIELFNGVSFGSPTGSFVIEIRSSSPTGTLICTSESIDIATLPVSAFLAYFINPPVLTGNTTYYFITKTTATLINSSNYPNLINDTGGGYSNGTLYINNGSWSSVSGNDLKFTIHNVLSKIVKPYQLGLGQINSTGFSHNNKTYYDPALWEGWSISYYFLVDSTDNAVSERNLYKDVEGTVIAISSVVNPDNSGISGAMTMPTNARNIYLNGVSQATGYTTNFRIHPIVVRVTSVNNTITAEAGSFALTGAPILFKRSLILSPTSYTFTGDSVILTKSKNIIIDPTTYSITGAPINFKRSTVLAPTSYVFTEASINFKRSIVLAPTSYVFTGASINFKRSIVLAPTSYTFTGAVVGLNRGLRLILSPTTYTFTGASINFKRSIVLAPTSYTFTGAVVDLNKGLRLILSPTTYNITGAVVGLNKGLRLILSPTTYIITGAPIGLNKGLRLILSPTTYIITVAPINLNRSTVLAPTSYIFTGAPINFKYSKVLASTSYTFTGAPINFNRSISLQNTSYTFTGESINLYRTKNLALDPTSFIITGASINFKYSKVLVPTSYTFTGNSINFKYSKVLNPTSYTFTGVPISISQSKILASTSYTFTGAPILFKRSLVLTPTSYIFTGESINLNRSISLQNTSYIFTGAPITFNYLRVLALDPTSYIFTGDEVTISNAGNIQLGYTTYNFTGSTLNISQSKILAPTSYTFTGASVNFKRSIALASTTYIFTGAPITFKRSTVLAPTSYTFTGASVNFKRSIALAPTSYIFTGEDLTISTAGSIQLDPTTYNITGSTLNISQSKVLAPTSYIFTGASISFKRSIALVPTTFTFTGAPIGLNRVITIIAGTYILSGANVQLTYTQSSSIVLDPTTYNLTGSSIGLNKGRLIVTEAGELEFIPDELNFKFVISLINTTYNFNPAIVDLNYSATAGFQLEPTSYTFTGNSIWILYNLKKYKYDSKIKKSLRNKSTIRSSIQGNSNLKISLSYESTI